MAGVAKYYLTVRVGGAVGPHKLDSLREWVGRGVIGADWQVCKEGEESWIALSQIPRFSEYPKIVRERLERFHQQQAREAWRSDAATEKQLAKLRYFDIPFGEEGLTKGRASELIDAFMAIDPERETQYQDRPSLGAQNKEIRALGGDPSDLTYSEAKVLIEELTQEWEEKEIEWMILDNKLNDEDVHEICGYKRLTKSQLTRLLDHFTVHVPDWRSKNRFDLGNIVVQVLAQLQQQKPPTLHRTPERVLLGEATVVPPLLPLHPPKRSNALARALILAVVVAGAAIIVTGFYAQSSGPSVSPQVPAGSVTTPTPNSLVPTRSTLRLSAAELARGVAQSQQRAVAKYPALGVANTELNLRFLFRYKQLQSERSPLLQDPDWPSQLADECAAASGIRGSPATAGAKPRSR